MINLYFNYMIPKRSIKVMISPPFPFIFIFGSMIFDCPFYKIRRRVLNIFNGCFSEMEITVNQDITPPIADAGEPFNLNCIMSENPLEGSFQNAQNVQFEWATFDGSFVSNSNISNPIINSSGTYILTVTNMENGCTDSDEVTISEDVLFDFEFEKHFRKP